MALNLGGGILRRLIGVGVMIAIGLGWWGFNTIREKSGAPDVGQCVALSGTATDADVDEADCGDDGVLYQVTADDGACDAIEVSYKATVNGAEAVDLCLEWDVAPGECVKVGTDKDELVDCAATKGDTETFKVTSVEDGAAGRCAKKREIPRANEKRDTLICVAPNV